jgi:WD40 repeat protein
MRIRRWLAVAVLVCVMAACGFGSDDDQADNVDSPVRATSATEARSTATTEASQIPATVVLEGHTGPVEFAAWSPDGSLLATAPDGFSSDDITPRLWNADGTLYTDIFGQPVAVTGLTWSADSQRLAIGGSDGVVRIVDREGTPSSTITVSNDDPPAPVANVAWSPDGALLATAVVAQPNPATPGPVNTLPATVQLWNPDGSEAGAFKLDYTFRGFVDLAWSADGSRLAAGGNDLHVWEAGGRELLVIPGGEYEGVSAWAFSPDGGTLAYVTPNGPLEVQPVDGGAPSFVQGLISIESLEFSPDSASLAVTTYNALTILSTSNPVGPPVQPVSNGVQSDPSWSPDSAQLATGTPGRSIQISDITHERLVEATGCEGFTSAIAWSPDGVSLAAGLDDGRVCLWAVPAT